MQINFDNIVFALQRTGGISVVWQQLLRRAVCDDDMQVKILDYPNHNTQRGELQLPVDQVLTMPYRRLERYRLPDYRTEKNELFHSSYFRILPGACNITTVHDLTYHFYRHGAAKAVHLWEEQRALRHSERVICVSENTRNDLLRLYPWLREDHLAVVPNGVSEAFFPLEKADNITPFQPGEYLLYVGNRAVDYKRFPIAIEVAAMVHMPLVIVGAPLQEKEEAELLARLGEGRYSCPGFMTEERLNHLYNNAFCLLYPSDYEGFGIPLLEAQRAGCPVVAQASSSIPEVTGRCALLVDSNADTHALAADMAEAVRQLLQGGISRQQLVESGFGNAATYSWDRTYKLTKQVYQSI